MNMSLNGDNSSIRDIISDICSSQNIKPGQMPKKTGINTKDVRSYFIFKNLERKMNNSIDENGLDGILPNEIVDSYHKVCSVMNEIKEQSQKKVYKHEPQSQYAGYPCTL